jgi:IS30 family transposase
LLFGSRNSQIATLVERQTRYVMLVKVAGKDTETGVSEFLCARRFETCPRRRSSLATNDRRGGQVGATYYAAVLVNRSA